MPATMQHLNKLLLSVRSYVQTASSDAETFCASVVKPLTESGVATSDLHNLMEIALRMEVNAELSRARTAATHDQPRQTVIARIRTLFDLATELALRMESASSTLPFLVLEDAMEALPIADCDAVWGLFEDRKEAFVSFLQLERNRMPLLRMASSMLRRISRTQHTVLFGRMLTALAYAFALTEKSGVNLSGALSAEAGAATLYEGRDGPGGDVEVIAELGRKTALPPPVPAGPPGPRGSGPVPLVPAPLPTLPAARDLLRAAAEEVAAGLASVSRAKAKAKAASAPAPAPAPAAAAATEAPASAAAEAPAPAPAPAPGPTAFYRTFWRLQYYMRNPAAATASAEAWAFFTKSVKIVLSAFEKEEAAAAAAAGAASTVAASSGATSTAAANNKAPAAAVPAKRPAAAAATASANATDAEEGEEPTPAPAQPSASTAAARGGPAPAAAGPGPGAAGLDRGRSGTPTSAAPASGSGRGAGTGAASSSATAAAAATAAKPTASTARAALTKPPSTVDFPVAFLESGPDLTVNAARLSHLHDDDTGASLLEDATDDADEFYAVKYLTNIRLLELELHDVALRRHVLLQLLFLFQYIDYQWDMNVVFKEDIPKPQLLKGKPPPAAAEASKATKKKPAVAFHDNIKSTADLAPLRTQTLQLLAKIGGAKGGGAAFARSVRAMLERDYQWRAWKAAGAEASAMHKPIPAPKSKDASASTADGPGEAAGAGADKEAGAGGDGSMGTMKRKAGAAGLGGGGASGKGAPSAKRARSSLRGAGSASASARLGRRPVYWTSSGLVQLERGDAWQLCAEEGRAFRPAPAELLAPARVAALPSSGVDEAYTPGATDAAYAWRAARLLAGRRLALLSRLPADGFSGMIRQLYGIPAPQPPNAASPAPSQETKAEGETTAEAATEPNAAASDQPAPAAAEAAAEAQPDGDISLQLTSEATANSEPAPEVPGPAPAQNESSDSKPVEVVSAPHEAMAQS